MPARPAAALLGGGAHKVVLLLLVAGLAGTVGLGFVGLSPNRILSPVAMPLWRAADPASLAGFALGLGLIVAGVADRPRWYADRAILLGATLIFLVDFAAAGGAATALVRQAASDAARVSLGGAFWAIMLVSGLAVAESLRRLRVGLALRLIFGAVILGAVALMALAGRFDDLSIVHEWANRRQEYAEAFGQHLRLVGTALAITLLVGVPIGVLTTVRPRLAGRIFTALNLVQTIPSIALFGLLIGPLSVLSDAVPGLRAIGVRGIGFTPAVIALVLYGLLPIARNTQVGLRGVPAPVIDAARGMGMTAFQIVTQVSVPLALPVILAGLRIVTVQLIGLAVVAALIGAGGFGSFVFLGLGQTATDLVLLGALSAILLALVADAALRLVTAAVAKTGAA